ncbi:TetR/AcrR family transcriptional regulator [Actinotalea caeni]|uniref:TetR/AcrR family transcriptional regulator n=1 Tax=Actinotalea caeni TaxID=1348467 RepID=UPI001F041932|nr:TetR/AcrR family transcriptional regulator [Actinotalea caeni]
MTERTTTETADVGEPRRRGPYRKSRLVRRRILDAALEVFAQSGYRTGSVREIAARVGMSEAGLLHHFPSKSALLAAVLAHRDALAAERVDRDTDDGLVALARLVGLARADADRPRVVELYCVISAEATAPDHPAHAFFVDRYARLRARIADSFERVRAAGQLRDGVDPQRAAAQMMAVWDGLQLQWLLDRSSVDVAAELADHVQRHLRVPLPRA